MEEGPESKRLRGLIGLVKNRIKLARKHEIFVDINNTWKKAQNPKNEVSSSKIDEMVKD